MNFDVTTNVKNRITNTNVPNPKEAAMTAANGAKDRVVDLAGGVPSQAADSFQTAFREALMAISEYVKMTSNAYSDIFLDAASSATAFQSALKANSASEAINALATSGAHILSVPVDYIIADSLSVPIIEVMKAGANILANTVTLDAIVQFAAPAIIILAVGYAAYRLRNYSREKLADQIEEALNKADDTIDLDDDDFEVVTVTEDDMEDGQEYECDRDGCDYTTTVPLHLAEHAASEHRMNGVSQ